VLIGITLMFLGVILSSINPIEDERIVKGDCFDRYHNKINELTCDVKENELSVAFYFGLAIASIGTITFIIGLMGMDIL